MGLVCLNSTMVKSDEYSYSFQIYLARNTMAKAFRVNLYSTRYSGGRFTPIIKDFITLLSLVGKISVGRHCRTFGLLIRCSVI